ncbi:hypothetical protein MFAL_06670 [Mycolicibacterium fallax]|nr:hypothetical protein MFAL_06670 [Mycolicibacterium fallax]
MEAVKASPGRPIRPPPILAATSFLQLNAFHTAGPIGTRREAFAERHCASGYFSRRNGGLVDIAASVSRVAPLSDTV